jgi:hypothetical protein
LAFTHFAQRQRRAAVRAKVLHRSGLVFRPTEESNAFVADLATQGLVGQLMRLTGHVPGIFDEHKNSFLN